jgi:hypothetical protein
MREAMDPMLFFPVVAALATGLAIALWRHNRDRAIMSAGLALISTYIIPGERALHEEVRGDLLLAVSVVRWPWGLLRYACLHWSLRFLPRALC